MAATVTGPIREGQINNDLYVGEGFFTTIQKAVDFARSTPTLNFCVIIPAGYTGADAISAVTNGSAQVIISDQRGPSPQSYILQGAGYVLADFVQGRGFIAQGGRSEAPASTAISYDPLGNTGIGTGVLIVNANAGKGMPAFNISARPGDGNPLSTFFRFDTDANSKHRVQMPQALELMNPVDGNYNLWMGQSHLAGAKGMTVTADPILNIIDFQGETVGGANDQTIRINPAGGNVEIATGVGASVATGALTVTGNAVVTGDLGLTGDLTADSAEFNVCEVANSPVRTFANTPDGPGQGMVWPTFGIPISEGDHWRDPSIDPASLVPYPAAGVPVSTGTAWGTPIDPATLPRTNTANTFTQGQTVQGNLVAQRLIAQGASSWFGQPEAVGAKGILITPQAAANAILIQGQTQGVAFDQTLKLQPQGGVVEMGNFRTVINNLAGVTTTNDGGVTLAWNISSSTGETDFINNRLGANGGFNWYNSAPNTLVNSSTVPVMQLDGSVGLTVGNVTTNRNNGAGVTTTNAGGVTLGWNISSATGETDFINNRLGAGGGFNWYNSAPNTLVNSSTVPDMRLDNVGTLHVQGKNVFGLEGNLSLRAKSTIGGNGEAIVRGGGGINQSILTLSPGHTNDALDFGRDSLFSVDRSGEYSFWSGPDSSGAGNSQVAIIDRVGNASFANRKLKIYDRVTGAPGAAPNISSDGSSLVLNAPTGQAIFFNLDSAGIVQFGNGAGGAVGNITTAGNATFSGTLTAGTKSFQITHPSDATKWLTHSCLEGPEIGVYYRGEAETAGGSVELTLPDYFEALVRPEGRTVLLTQLFEQDTEDFAQLAASRVVGGKFRVRSSVPVQKFYWEVKAVRADQPLLEVIKPKPLEE